MRGGGGEGGGVGREVRGVKGCVDGEVKKTSPAPFPHMSDPLSAISQDLVHPKKKKNNIIPNNPFSHMWRPHFSHM